MQSLGWGVIGIGKVVQGTIAPAMVADEVVGSVQVVHLEVGSGPRHYGSYRPSPTLGACSGGAAGLARVLAILRKELCLAMANIGCREVDEITQDRVRWSVPAPASVPV